MQTGEQVTIYVKSTGKREEGSYKSLITPHYTYTGGKVEYRDMKMKSSSIFCITFKNRYACKMISRSASQCIISLNMF